MPDRSPPGFTSTAYAGPAAPRWALGDGNSASTAPWSAAAKAGFGAANAAGSAASCPSIAAATPSTSGTLAITCRSGSSCSGGTVNPPTAWKISTSAVVWLLIVGASTPSHAIASGSPAALVAIASCAPSADPSTTKQPSTTATSCSPLVSHAASTPSGSVTQPATSALGTSGSAGSEVASSHARRKTAASDHQVRPIVHAPRVGSQRSTRPKTPGQPPKVSGAPSRPPRSHRPARDRPALRAPREAPADPSAARSPDVGSGKGPSATGAR
jgi:hypothetical protein